MYIKQGLTMWVIQINGIIQSEVKTSLYAACKASGVAYRTALRGKRIFKGVILTEVNLIKNKALKRDGFACLEIARMERYKRDSSFNEDI